MDKELKEPKGIVSEQTDISIKREIIKRNQIEILKLKSTTPEMKNWLEGFNNRFEQAKESVKESRLKYSAWRIEKENAEKLIEPKETCGTLSSICIKEVPRREKKQKEYLKKQWPKVSQILWNAWIYTSKKLNKFQIR